MRTTIGIDLGTTHTVAAVDRIPLKVEPNSERLVASVVAFPPTGARLVGEAARRRRPIDPKNTIYSAKRLIGRPWRSHDTREFQELYPFDLEPDDQGAPAFRTRAGLLTPTQIATIILEAVLSHAHQPPSELSGIVAVPSMFENAHREATLEAARRAGLGEVRVIDEPLATALAYRARFRDDHRNVAVFDLGGGTFDLAVIDCTKEPFKVLSHGGDLYLGGDDVDRGLAKWAAHAVLAKHHWDLTDDREVYIRLMLECEQAKIRLIGAEKTSLDLTRVDPGSAIATAEVTLERGVLAEVTDALVRRTFIICDQVLRDAGVTVRDLDAVYLAGGATLLPIVKDRVERYFDQSVTFAFHPMHIVAIGASLADEDDDQGR